MGPKNFDPPRVARCGCGRYELACGRQLASAICHCIAVNDTYEVSLDEILNATLQAETKARCTVASPCELNAAPVCRAVREGGVFGGRAAAPGMVSTFSWAGWCEVNGKYGISTPI